VFKSVARYVFAFDFLLDSSLSVVVLWYSEECGDMCASFCVLVCDSNTHVRLKHEIDHRSSKDTLKLEDRKIRMNLKERPP